MRGGSEYWAGGVAVVVATLDRPAVVGSQEPRVSCIPDGEDHPRWAEVVDFVRALGVVLDPWQWLVLRVALRRLGGMWAAFVVAVCAPRQNGKNAILEIRELIGPLLLGEELVIHSAHLADTSKEGFRRLDQLIDMNEWLSCQVKHIWRTNGHESIEFKNGNRIRFRTRTRGGGRGFAASPVVFDEAMFLPEISLGAIMPVVSAQEDPQLWYMGSAVDQLIHEDGVVFARQRAEALGGESKRLAYFEWSIDAEKPDEVEPEQATDPEAWAQSNPALGVRISPNYIAEEYRSMADRTFAVERLGVGDWPDPGRSSTVIDLAAWDALTDSASKITGDVVFGFDVSPSRGSAAISAAGGRGDLVHLETTDHAQGTGWVVDRVVELAGRHKSAKIVCDGASPAGALIPSLEQRGLTIECLTAQEYARACGVLFDLVEQQQIRHLGTSELRSAIKGAATRPLGDAWAWSRKNSGVDISPLVAATLAAWGAKTARDSGVFMEAW